MNSTTEVTTVNNEVNATTISSNLTSSDDDDGVNSRVAAIKATVRDCYFYSMGVVIPTGIDTYT